MTARHQIRIGNRRLGRDRTPIDATPAPPVGETLQAARERKGVDLYRAERDTKIRLRYLAALEDSDYDELPAPVYVKGFLRNYAIYLGLDPDEVLDRWHEEMEQMRTATRVAVAPPPMPLVEPGGRRVTITPAMFVAGLVLMAVVAFVGYLGIQFLRFAQVTPIALTYPADRISQIDAESIVLEGTSGPGSLVTITGSASALYNATANDEGEWQSEVELARGPNEFTIVARDPVTGRESDAYPVTIIVPLPQASATPSGGAPTSAPAAPLTMTLDSPATGATVTGPDVTFSGTTTGTRLTIASTYLGTLGSTPAPSPQESPSAEPGRTPSPAPIGPASDVAINPAGAFSQALAFEPGRWSVVVTAFASGQDPQAETIELNVQSPAATTITLVISVENRDSWVRVVSDGERFPGYASRTLREGETHTVTADSEMCLRAGNAGALHLTLNGVDIGFLGERGEAGSWLIVLGQEPVRAPAPCA
jgi:cytoskeletal protein RodZ